MAADVEPLGWKAWCKTMVESKLIRECQTGRRVEKRQIKEYADQVSLHISLAGHKWFDMV